MKIKVKIFNMSNKNTKGSVKIHFTGYIELNGNEIVNCDTNTIEKEIDVVDKNATLVWKRAKEDPIECGIFKFSFNDNVENILLIQNAPAFEGVKVLLNEERISGKHYYNDKLI